MGCPLHVSPAPGGGAPEEVRAFLAKWMETADRSAGDLDEETAAMLHAYDNWAGGGYEGVEIRDEAGRLVSIAIYSLPAPGLGVEHFEKADHEVKGASQMATWEAAKRMRARGAKWINREQDLGVPGDLLPVFHGHLGRQPLREIGHAAFRGPVTAHPGQGVVGGHRGNIQDAA